MLCDISVEIKVSDVVIRRKNWKSVDVMKTSGMRGWTRRQFNFVLKDMSSCLLGRDKIVTAFYECRHRSSIKLE